MRLEVIVRCAAFVLSLAGGLSAATVLGQTPQPGTPPAAGQNPILVELFTSEGCSSCPPADDLLRKIDGKHLNGGPMIVGVSEHVTYWDHGGWKDPFDSDAVTDRQTQYSQKFHLDSPYTPQIVVNGKTQLVGSDGPALLKAISEVQQQEATVKIVSAKVEGGSVVASVAVAGELSKHGADLYVVVAQDETTTKVTAGENKGRTLQNAAVARTFQKAARLKAIGETTVRIPLPVDLKTTADSRRHLIVWAQEPDLGPVLGVDTLAF